MTGDFVDVIDCHDIENFGNNTTHQVLDFVYFGSIDSLDMAKEKNDDGQNPQLFELMTSAMIDRFHNHREPARQFWINAEEECASKYGIGPEQTGIVLFVKNSKTRQEPYIWIKDDGDRFV